MTDQSPDKKSSDVLAAANQLARELLIPSFVADFVCFGGLPTIRFANNQPPATEVWLSMEASFSVTPTPNLPQGLSARQRELLWLESLYGLDVAEVQCSGDSSLHIRFSNGSSLDIAGIGTETCEPWTLREDRGRAEMVALQGGGYALWDTRFPK